MKNYEKHKRFMEKTIVNSHVHNLQTLCKLIKFIFPEQLCTL